MENRWFGNVVGERVNSPPQHSNPYTLVVLYLRRLPASFLTILTLEIGGNRDSEGSRRGRSSRGTGTEATRAGGAIGKAGAVGAVEAVGTAGPVGAVGAVMAVQGR